MAEQHKLNGRDYISRLPDEMLLIILSKLNLPEQARTTILSTRWRNLWTLSTTSVLRLDASDFIPFSTEYLQGYEEDYQDTAMNIKFEDTIVDQILRQYTGEIIDELHISYVPCDFDTPVVIRRYPWAKVDTWVEIAKQKSVKTLSLSFEDFMFYEFPSHELSPLKSLTSTTLLSLVTLRLQCPPGVPGGYIENILSSFPNLEEFSIECVNCFLLELRIEGPSLKLKHLEIRCLRVGFLYISAPNLVSFNCLVTLGTEERIAKVHLQDVPLLAQFSYSEFEFDYSPTLMGSQDSHLSGYLECRASACILCFPAAMTNLKQLNFGLGKAANEALHLFFSLLEASPNLCTLSLHLGFFMCPLVPNHHFAINKCLEEVQIDGFSGFDNEVQLVMCIAQFSPSLKKIMIWPSLSKFSIDQNADIYTEQHNVISSVQLLQSRLPQQELVII